MSSDAFIWVDFAGSLAIIFVLTLVYGQIQRAFEAMHLGQILLGIAFGGVAWLQMHMPLEPMSGLIIDLRNIPLVLCGAFLGWRASLFCFAIAAATRIELGGVGMYSGVLAMMIAVCVGWAWSYLTRRIQKRSIWHMALLGICASFHLAAAFILPEAARIWFLSNASVPIATLNFVCITLAACLLESEQRKLRREKQLASSAVVDPDHGALTRPAFEREIELRIKSRSMAPPAALMVVKLRHSDVLFSIIPGAWRDKVLGLVRLRLQGAFEHADLVCSLGGKALVFPLDAEQFSNKEALENHLLRLMRSEPFEFSDKGSRLIAVETRVQPWPADKTLSDVLKSAQYRLMSKRKDRAPWSSPALPKQGQDTWKQVKVSGLMSHSTTDALFLKAKILMEPRRSA